MKLLKISEDKKGFTPHIKLCEGFTVIEIVIVVAILSTIAGLGLIFGIDFYKSYSFDAERNVVLRTLQKARNRAQNNINQSSHGVYFQSNNYVIFQGSSYVSRNDVYDQIIPRNPAISAGGISEIIFQQLSGDSQTVGDIILDNGRRTAIISINNEGKIDWQ